MKRKSCIRNISTCRKKTSEELGQELRTRTCYNWRSSFLIKYLMATREFPLVLSTTSKFYQIGGMASNSARSSSWMDYKFQMKITQWLNCCPWGPFQSLSLMTPLLRLYTRINFHSSTRFKLKCSTRCTTLIATVWSVHLQAPVKQSFQSLQCLEFSNKPPRRRLSISHL